MKIIRYTWYLLGRLISLVALPLLAKIVFKDTHRTRVIVYYDGKIIVEKNWLGEKDWVLPGGGVKPGESVELCVVRELFEEVGVEVASSQVRVLKKQKSPIKGYGFNVSYCLVILDSFQPIKVTGLEVFSAKWVPVEDINSLKVVADIPLALELSIQAEPNLLQ